MFKTKIESVGPLTGFDRLRDQFAQVRKADYLPCRHASPFNRTAGSLFNR